MQDPVENLALSLIKGHSGKSLCIRTVRYHLTSIVTAVEGVLNLKEGPPGVRREDRQGQRKYIRDNINPKFRKYLDLPHHFHFCRLTMTLFQAVQWESPKIVPFEFHGDHQ